MDAYEAVREELREGRQAYVICPLVEESEALEDVRSAEELHEELSEEVFPVKRTRKVAPTKQDPPPPTRTLRTRKTKTAEQLRDEKEQERAYRRAVEG